MFGTYSVCESFAPPVDRGRGPPGTDVLLTENQDAKTGTDGHRADRGNHGMFAELADVDASCQKPVLSFLETVFLQ